MAGKRFATRPGSTACSARPTAFATLHFTLGNQSNSATVGHAEAPLPISDAQRAAIVDFQTGLFTAQIFDRQVGYLTTQGARGGVVALSNETFYFGINDTLVGDYRTQRAVHAHGDDDV